MNSQSQPAKPRGVHEVFTAFFLMTFGGEGILLFGMLASKTWYGEQFLHVSALWLAFCFVPILLAGFGHIAPHVQPVFNLTAIAIGELLGARENARKNGQSIVSAKGAETAGAMTSQGDVDPTLLRNTAWAVLIRHHSGVSYSRQKMVADGVCDQRYWNLVSRAMTTIGLKDGYSLKSRGDLELDKGHWHANTRLVMGHLYVNDGEGQWEEVV